MPVLALYAIEQGASQSTSGLCGNSPPLPCSTRLWAPPRPSAAPTLSTSIPTGTWAGACRCFNPCSGSKASRGWPRAATPWKGRGSPPHSSSPVSSR